MQTKMGVKDYFFMSFGFIVGVGWVIATGQWIEDAGPLGASLAFLAGGLLLIPVGLCYAELGSQFPFNGGVVHYAFRAFGRDVAFFVAVLFLLTFVSTLLFFSISVAWLFETLLPTLRGPALYTVRGSDVTVGGVTVAAACSLLIGIMTYIGVAASARLQQLMVLLLVAIAFILVIVGVTLGDMQNLSPLIKRVDGSAWGGMAAVFVVTPFSWQALKRLRNLLVKKVTRSPPIRLVSLLPQRFCAPLRFTAR